ncbi:MAG TPA: hypothetical protein VKM94_21815 [Blastocatellia bacterium]|nr:hypothetical protein [Blastocatellia bacterium]
MREVNVTRVACSGAMRREEWKANGEERALIWRPDLGKSFLLDLGQKTYTESKVSEDRSAPPESDLEAVERELTDSQSPDSVQSRMLPDEKIEGRQCAVYETRVVYVGGSSEVIRTHRDKETGLILRQEISEASGRSVVTERKEVTLSVSPDMFEVPADFKRTP